jgi:hypothetical protein
VKEIPKFTLKVGNPTVKRFIDEVLGDSFDFKSATDYFEADLKYLQEREWSEPFYIENNSKFSILYEGEVLKGTKKPLGRGRLIN